MLRKKRGQIWVETVIYTLIALAMIGLVLTFARPKVEEIRDQTIVEQSIQIMEELDLLILSLHQGGAGNKRLIELGIEKGNLKIDGEKDTITFEVESRYVFSEPGEDINYGNIVAHTRKMGELNMINLTLSYDEYNLTYKGEDKIKTLGKSSTPQVLFISNKGIVNDKTLIDIELN